MEVIRTFKDLIPIAKNKTIAHLAFNRKAVGGFHQGHIDCINTLMSCNTDIKLVCQYPNASVMNTFVPNQQSISESNWDENYNIDFFSNTNIDILFIPSQNEVLSKMNSVSNISNVLQDADQLILDKQYNAGTNQHYLRGLITMVLAISYTNSYSKEYSVFSAKDGILSYIRKDFLEGIGSTCIMIPESYRPDGLPHSSGLSIMNLSELNSLTTIYNIFRKFTYNDAKKPVEDLKELLKNNDINIISVNRYSEKRYIPNGGILLEIHIGNRNNSIYFSHLWEK